MAYVDNFNTDYQTLKNDADQFGQIQQQLTDDVNAYKDAYQKVMKEKDPGMIWAMLIYLLSVQGGNQLDDQLKLYGSGIKISSDLTKIGNDLETLTNQNVGGPTPDPGTVLVENEVSHLDVMLDTLSTNTLVPGAAEQPNANILAAMGGTAATAYYNELFNFRRDIHWSGDPHKNDDTTQDYNPTEVSNPSSTGPRSYHFDLDNNAYLADFAQLQADMSAQGDPLQANEAYKLKSDVFNTNTTTTQSVNQAGDAKVNTQKDITNATQAFMTAMMHAWSDVISATIKAPKGS